MNAIFELFHGLINGEIPSISWLIGLFLGFVFYKIAGKHIDEIYTYARKRKSNSEIIIKLQADIISANKRNAEIEEMLTRYIEHSNRQRLVIKRQRFALKQQKSQATSPD